MRRLILVLYIVLLFPLGQISAQTQFLQFNFDGINRSCYVFLPQNFQPNMPVVFNLHGATDNAIWQMEYSLMNDVADTAGFIVVYPQAIWPGFNTGNTDVTPPLPIDVDDVGFISALIDTVKARFDIDLSRVYCTGFSNGAFMTYNIACLLGQRFAAVAGVCGELLLSTEIKCKLAAPIPVLMINGTADGFLPPPDNPIMYNDEETFNFWAQKNNCIGQADTISLPDLDPNDHCAIKKISYTNCSDETSVIFYKVINGGHSWPSGTKSGTWSGFTNRDINANVEIWNFFKNFENLDALGVEESVPESFALIQNYPNPFNPSTTINYTISQESLVIVTIYDILGMRIVELENSAKEAGMHSIKWNGLDYKGSSVSAGIYLYQIQAGQFVQTRKMVLLK